jgi:hypothetical protein
MNWKLILGLSMFALVMAFATVFFIPLNVEPFCWVPIFLVCAVIIGRQTTVHRFLHGLFLGLVNCVWITIAHVGLFDQYLAHHPGESAMLAQSPLPTHPRLTMALGGAVVGVVSGVVIGLFAMAAGKLMKGSSRTEKALSQSA